MNRSNKKRGWNALRRPFLPYEHLACGEVLKLAADQLSAAPDAKFVGEFAEWERGSVEFNGADPVFVYMREDYEDEKRKLGL